jgi:putative transposase
MVYIDLNMVRAGVVNHPEKWEESGFCEIQKPPKLTPSSTYRA